MSIRPLRQAVRPSPIFLALIAVTVVGAALASRDDTPTSAGNSSAQLADISQACTTWMDGDARWGSMSAGWCQEMTGWMDQQMTNGSMMGSRMWSDPDRMLSTCRAWLQANPSSDRPADWCDNMMTGMWPHMNGDWGNWNEQMNGPMMGG